MENAQRTTSHQIKADIPCIHCGYNLRTLNEEGLCPECGQGIAESAIKWRIDQHRAAGSLKHADRRWLKIIAEALVLALLALLMQMIVLSAPDSMFRRHTWSRFTLAALASASWTFYWLSAWKLNSPDPAQIGTKSSAALRVTSTMCMVAPILSKILDDSGRHGVPKEVVLVPMIFCFLAILPATWLFHLRLGDLANRGQDRTIPVITTIAAACATLAVAIVLYPEGRDHVRMLMAFPIPPFGLTNSLTALYPRRIPSEVQWVFLAVAVIWLASVYAVVRCLFLFIQAIRAGNFQRPPTSKDEPAVTASNAQGNG